jgi:Fe-S oxidoreductase
MRRLERRNILPIEAGARLLSRHRAGQLKTEFSRLPLRVGYHTPCHIKALKTGLPFRELLELIPQLEVLPIDKGCSGMAGTFGLTREHFDESIAIGRGLIERMHQPDLIAGATECSSCRLQMQQGTDTPTIDPMAIAYGLLPRLKDQLLSLVELFEYGTSCVVCDKRRRSLPR